MSPEERFPHPADAARRALAAARDALAAAHGDPTRAPADRWRRALEGVFGGRPVAVWGAAKSGVAAANLLADLGARVLLSDPKPDLDRAALALHPAVALHLGANTLGEGGEGGEGGEARLLIPSPALKPTHPLLLSAAARGVELMSEIELGAWCTRARLFGVSGTDGKSTTTCLIGHALRAAGLRALEVGNIGEPICLHALSAEPHHALSVEVSAFQLWSTRFFPAEAGVITNIAEDHYDHFDHQPALYRAAKVRLAYLLRPGGRLLAPLGLPLDLEGERPADLPAPQLPALERFGLTPDADWGAHGGRLWRGGEALGDLSASPLLGRHNQLNLCAALGVTHGACPPADLLAALPTFEALPHRMQHTRHLNGARWINDSKATNVHAALAGLRSVDEPLVVIAGGYEKGLDYTELVTFLAARARHTCLIGQVGPRLADALAAAGAGERLTLCGDLPTAVARAREVARAGDLVVLSPASSSFDQFKGFDDRGRRFMELVAALSSP